MRNLGGGNLLSTRSLVDAHHGEADGPGRVADGRGDVDVIGCAEVARLAVGHHLLQLVADVRRNLPLLAHLEQRSGRRVIINTMATIMTLILNYHHNSKLKTQITGNNENKTISNVVIKISAVLQQ